MNITPSGYQFRKFMNNWQDHVASFREDDERSGKKARVHLLIHGRDFIMFFLHKDDIYAANEDFRLTFATMMDEEEPGASEMSFGATNLSALLQGKDSVAIFRHKDISDIKMISPEEAEHRLLEKKHNKTKEISDRLEISSGRDQKKHGLHQIDKDVE